MGQYILNTTQYGKMVSDTTVIVSENTVGRNSEAGTITYVGETQEGFPEECNLVYGKAAYLDGPVGKHPSPTTKVCASMRASFSLFITMSLPMPFLPPGLFVSSQSFHTQVLYILECVG